MDRQTIETTAMILLGQTNFVSHNNADEKVNNVPIRSVCNELFLLAVKSVLESYPWTFLRTRFCLKRPIAISETLFKDMIDAMDDNDENKITYQALLNRDSNMHGAVAIYSLSSKELSHPYRGFLNVYNENWRTVIDYNGKGDRGRKMWWLMQLNKDNEQRLYSLINPFNYDGKFRSLNIEYSSYHSDKLPQLHVPTTITTCIAYCLAHLACVAITGSNAEAVRLYQQYQSILEQCKIADNKTATPAQVMSLNRATSNELLAQVTHTEAWWNRYI